jgi:hypothetical protein
LLILSFVGDTKLVPMPVIVALQEVWIRKWHGLTNIHTNAAPVEQISVSLTLIGLRWILHPT